MEPILNVIGDQVLRIGERFEPKRKNLKDIQIEFQILGDLFGQFIDANKKAWKTHPIYQQKAKEFNDRLSEALGEIGEALYEFGEKKLVDQNWRKLQKILYEAQEYLSYKITNDPSPQDQAEMTMEKYINFIQHGEPQ